MQRNKGIVSIIVTMVMMLVISLMVLGFAQLSRREARESLDRQLSTQAFLAAETGINDASKSISSALAAGQTLQSKTSCGPDSNYPYNEVIDTANNVKYTCLLVNPTPTIAKADVAANDHSVVVNVEPVGSMEYIAFRWTNKQSPSAASLLNCLAPPLPATPMFPSISSGNWTCPYGVVRVDIVPTSTLSRAAMEAGQKTFFMYPYYDATGTSYPNSNFNTTPNFDGKIVGMACLTSVCRYDVHGLTGGKYMVRLSAYYVGGDMGVDARTTTSVSLPIANSQVQIDATGRAQDVLRRVQVRMPVNNTAGTVPDYAIASASSICKRFESTGSTLTSPGDIQGQDPNNPMCF